MKRPDLPYDLIIFDLDGVITTEHIYWECARLTLWELLHLCLQAAGEYVPAVHDPEAREAILPQPLIFEVKNRAVNSNWDLTFLASCALLDALQARVSQSTPTADALLQDLRRNARSPVCCPAAVGALLAAAGERRGIDLLAFAGRRAGESTGAPADLFQPEGAWWRYTYERFQLWYGGLLMGLWGADPLAERLVLPADDIRAALDVLGAAGYTLGAATGRLRQETLPPLRSLSLLDCFSAPHIATYSEVEEAQQALGLTSLGKPHPYLIRRAMYPQASAAMLVDGRIDGLPVSALVVGDSASDALAAQAAGVPCVGVLSGVVGEQARQSRRAALLEAGCIAVLDDVTALPEWLNAREPRPNCRAA